MDLYNSAHRITQGCKLQRDVFRYWERHDEALIFDTETTSVSFHMPSYLHLNEHTDILVHNPTPFGLSLAIPYKDEIALFWGRIGTVLYDEITKLLTMSGYKVAHNAKYDIRVLREQSIGVAPTIDCTLTMSRIYWDRRMKHSLQALSEVICPELSDWEEPIKRELKRMRSAYTRRGYPKGYVNYSFLPDEMVSEYSMTDCFVDFILDQKLHSPMRKEYKELYDREVGLTPLIIRMEERGMRFDSRRARVELHALTKQQVKLEKKLKKYGPEDFNPYSPAQLLPVLLANGITKKELTSEGKLTTEKKRLEKIRPECGRKQKHLINLVLDLRSTTTLVNRYLEPLLHRAQLNAGIIYFSLNPTDTRTGRMTGTDPNMHNLPRPKSGFAGHNPIRACFICRTGYWMYFFDYKVMELVVFGIMAKDSRIINWFLEGKDLHEMMGGAIFGSKDISVGNLIGTREVTKHLSYAYIFGTGVGGLMRDFQMTYGEADRCLGLYAETFPSYLECKEQHAQDIRDHGYIEGLFGKRYHISPEETYKGVNAVVQGDCSQTLKIASDRIDTYVEKALPSNTAHLLLPIHDELITERRTPNEKQEQEFIHTIKDSMEVIEPFMRQGVRLQVDVSRTKTNWAAKEELAS